jgi:hypothetical protein
MYIPTDHFVEVFPKNCIFEVITVTEENMKYIYSYLKSKGCENFPDERQAAGQIWLYDDEPKDCIA